MLQLKETQKPKILSKMNSYNQTLNPDKCASE